MNFMAQGQNESSAGQLVSVHPAREGLKHQERQDTATGPSRAQPESSLVALSLPTSSFRPGFVGSGSQVATASPVPARGEKSKSQRNPRGKNLQVNKDVLLLCGLK